MSLKKNTKKIGQRFFALFMLALVLVGVVAPLPIVKAAAPLIDSYSMYDKTKSLVYYLAISKCIDWVGIANNINYDYNGGNWLDPTGAAAGNWFKYNKDDNEYGQKTYGQRPFTADTLRMGWFLGDGVGAAQANLNNVYRKCEDSTWIKDALGLWGYSDDTKVIEALCQMGVGRYTLRGELDTTEYGDGAMHYSQGTQVACEQGNSDQRFWKSVATNAEQKTLFQTLIKNKIYGGADPQYTNGMKYTQAWRTFVFGCIGEEKQSITRAEYEKDVKSITANNAQTQDKIQPYINAKYIVPSTGDKVYIIQTGRTGADVAHGIIDDNMNEDNGMSCLAAIDRANSFRSDYDKEAAIIKKNNPAKKIDEDPLGGKAVVKNGGADKTTTSPAECQGAGALGWILCPVIKFMAAAADGAKNFLATNFLEVKSSVLDPNGVGKTVYDTWQNIRTIANILFVLFFMVIIFSQVTGAGITNYGIKKLLPKLIIAAVLVNLSFFICQVAVDLSNIAGFSAGDIFRAALPQAATPEAAAQSGDFSAIGGAFILGAATAIMFALFASTLIPIALAALVSALMIMLLLVGRQAIIILLVIVSPLAFVAYLLPNTKKLYDQWQKTFVAMLILFPIISIIFGASKAISQILGQVWGVQTGGKNWILGICAAAISTLPLFVVPGLLKKSMDGIGQIGAKINGMGDKLGKGAGDKFSNSSMGKKLKANETMSRNGTYNGKNPFRKVQSLGNSKFNNSKLGQFLGGDRKTVAGLKTRAAFDKEEMETASLAMDEKHNNPATAVEGLTKELSDALASGNEIKARAARKLLEGKGGAGKKAIRQVINDAEDPAKPGSIKAGMDLSKFKSEMLADGIKSGDAGRAKWCTSSNGDTLEQITNQAATYEGLSDADLSTQSLEGLKASSAGGVLTAERATGIINNTRLSGSMGKDELNHLRAVAATGTSTPTHINGSGI